MGDTLSLIGKGALAGAVATTCMSALMLLSKRLGVQGEHPPKRITQAALKKAGADRQEGPAVNALSTAAHLAFGAGGGSVFALLRQKIRTKHLPGLQGLVLGSFIWLVSYSGWVPALRIMPPAHRDRPGRVVTMLAAHLVYGAVLGELVARWISTHPSRS